MTIKVLSTRQLFNLAICALGIQFATSLQMANMSSLYNFLGASSASLSYLWLAAPITGLFIQPLVGQLSDSTVTRYGKRIPYIFVWGILSCITLAFMPFSTAIWMAAAYLWIFGSSINGITETLRSLTADLTPPNQKASAFAIQSIAAGIGAGFAAFLPWIFSQYLHVNAGVQAKYSIPFSIKIAFIIGGLVLLFCIFWTVWTIKEQPFKREHLLSEKKHHHRKSNSQKIKEYFWEIIYNIKHMPKVIRQFYIIQIFTWVGLYTFWLYFGMAISQHVFGLPAGVDAGSNAQYSKLLTKGTEWAGICIGVYQFVSVIYALMLPSLADKTSPKFVHAFSLIAGAVGVIAMVFFHHPHLILISMIGVGIMWGSIMTMPYAIVTAGLPKTKIGVYLGIFNITTTLPQIISGLILGPINKYIFAEHAMVTLVMGGVFLLIAGLIMLWQDEKYGFANSIKIIIRKVKPGLISS